MASIQELRKARIAKLEALKKVGIEPYPARTHRTHSIAALVASFASFEKEKKAVVVAGRVIARREHGSLLFLDIQEGENKIQLHCQEQLLGEKKFKAAFDFIDIGDFIEAHGVALTTKRGEKSIDVKDFVMLAKALRPVPTTWYGFKNIEERLRHRYIDLLVHEDVRELFRKKSLFWHSVRSFLLGKEFLEVETPVFEDVPGGAEAEPFKTHYNALNKDFYLRISLELSLKKLIVGGYEKVFEMGRIFRNEGIDAEHLQEYTQMEFYWAFADYYAGMELTQVLYQELVQKICGSMETQYDGNKIVWSGIWPKVDYFELFKKETGIDLNNARVKELQERAKELKLDYDKYFGFGRLVDIIFKRLCRPKLIQPCFLIHPPVEIEPLAKRLASNPKQVERFQIMAAGTELGKGFSELNDPLDQRVRFEEQMELRKRGDREAQMLNEDFLEALEYGMPPTCGFGMSERLFAVLMNKPIRETTIFPYFKEKND